MFIAFAITLTACYTDEDKAKLQEECKVLVQQKKNLQTNVLKLYKDIDALNTEINELKFQKNTLKTGREINYIVKFRIKQSTFTLDIFEHIKNGVNAIELELPVNKAFYDRVSVGTKISKSFKMGSLIFDGDFSNLNITVIGKRIE